MQGRRPGLLHGGRDSGLLHGGWVAWFRAVACCRAIPYSLHPLTWGVGGMVQGCSALQGHPTFTASINMGGGGCGSGL